MPADPAETRTSLSRWRRGGVSRCAAAAAGETGAWPRLGGVDRQIYSAGYSSVLERFQLRGKLLDDMVPGLRGAQPPWSVGQLRRGEGPGLEEQRGLGAVSGRAFRKQARAQEPGAAIMLKPAGEVQHCRT